MQSAVLRRRLRLGLSLVLLATAAAASGPKAAVAPHEGHEDHGGGEGDPLIATPEALGATACRDGFAGPYPCRGVDLQSFVPLGDLSPRPGDRARGIWGWTDPQTRREYAIIALAEGTSFVDITRPASPRVVGYLPGITTRAPNREVNVYRDHALIAADGAGAHGLQIFDLTQLRRLRGPRAQLRPTSVYQGVGRVHTITVNPDTGFAYANGSDRANCGFHMLDVRRPRTPVFAGCYTHPTYTYVHDSQCVVYRGPDTRFSGHEVCFGSSVGGGGTGALVIVDVSDKGAPRLLAAQTYQGVGFTHQAWLTEDHRHLAMDDEADEFLRAHNTRTYLWDLSDLTAPRQFATHDAPTSATDHNQFIHQGRLYQANYRAGLRILDVAEIAAGRLEEVGYFDVVPEADGTGFSGAWSVYPFFRSGNVIVSGIEQGLFIVRPTGRAASEPVPTSCRPGPDHLCLLGNRYWVDVDWTNPFDGTSGEGRAVGAGSLSGYFHFGDPGNLELMVKVLPFGGDVRFFYGQLTNLEFTIRVVDTRTGVVRRYRNGPNNCGGSDLFAGASAASTAPSLLSPQVFDFMAPGRGISGKVALAAPAGAAPAAEPHALGSCAPGRNRLCLGHRRFQVELDWRNQFDGASGRGVAIPLSEATGSFAYNDPRNVELLVKVLDQGDRILVIWGALSNLEYTLRVTDTTTGAVETFHNPAGTYCGGLEEAF
ncbi:MAG TPA: choice-of-anchor B family protein [Thermoanaerobaculia bacterium]|nr:choice-of-anchor B family protein [Thermoanaerobaculia bacterium]